MMTTQTETNAKTPSHTIYVVEAKEGNAKSDWLKVGAAWEHSDKDGMTLSINTLGAAYLQTKGQDASLTVRRNKPQD
jgi:outer membrane usher protein FimD/PapC